MPGKIKVVTQNCFFGKKVKEVIKLIKTTSADVYCLQEVSGQEFTERVKKETGYSYILSKPIKTFFPGLYFHNALFTNLPILDSGELNWIKQRRKWIDLFGGKAFWADIRKGTQTVRVYSCYLSVTDQGVEDRHRMMLDIVENSKYFQGPVIVSGDMNTVIPDMKPMRWVVKLWHRFPDPSRQLLGKLYEKNEKYYFLETWRKNGFEELSDMSKNTWRDVITGRELFNLKLDWMLYRNCDGISCTLGEWIGDHKAIIGELLLK